MNPQRYKLNTPSVVQETFDGETVILNLVSGYYYSATKSGVAIWNQLLEGRTAAEIAAHLGGQYQASSGQLTTAVEEFSSKLLAEQLIAPLNGESLPQSQKTQEPNSTLLPFEPPVLEKYTDMQDLLLLDPIHEVDDTGWPARKKNDDSKKAP